MGILINQGGLNAVSLSQMAWGLPLAALVLVSWHNHIINCLNTASLVHCLTQVHTLGIWLHCLVLHLQSLLPPTSQVSRPQMGGHIIHPVLSHFDRR